MQYKPKRFNQIEESVLKQLEFHTDQVKGQVEQKMILVMKMVFSFSTQDQLWVCQTNQRSLILRAYKNQLHPLWAFDSGSHKPEHVYALIYSCVCAHTMFIYLYNCVMQFQWTVELYINSNYITSFILFFTAVRLTGISAVTSGCLTVAATNTHMYLFSYTYTQCVYICIII